MIATLHIGGRAAQTNYYAAQQAARIGFPLNHLVTVNYSHTAIDPREAVASFSRLRRDHFNKWAARPRKGHGPAFPPTYMFAFENTRDGVPFMTMKPGDPHNVHVHWAIHLPPSRVHEFTQYLWRWVEITTGGITTPDGAILVQRYVPRIGYLIKGTTPFFAQRYGRGQEAIPQGIIIRRRADTSRNLGPTARRELDRMLGVNRQPPGDRRAA